LAADRSFMAHLLRVTKTFIRRDHGSQSGCPITGVYPETMIHYIIMRFQYNGKLVHIQYPKSILSLNQPLLFLKPFGFREEALITSVTWRCTKGISRTRDNDDNKMRHKKTRGRTIDILTIIFYYQLSPITKPKHARSISHGRK
jgi:hypothetical protein